MIDKSLIWTGHLNDRAIHDIYPEHVGLYDTTLRDGEQTVGVALNPELKLEIARALDGLGVDRIEAGFPKVSEDDERAYRLILDAGLQAEIWGFSRAVTEDVEQLIDLGVTASVIEAPVSDGKLAAYGLDRGKVLERIRSATELAVDHEMKVCFFAVDSTRADLEFLEEVYRTAVQAGAQEIAVVDTIGIAAPETVEYLIRQARNWVGPDVPIHWHGHNDFGLATAGAIAAVRGGASWVQGTINGMGERAGNANIAEVALALEALYGVQTNLVFDRLIEVADLVRKRSGYELEPWKPVTGENLYIRESGAVAMQFHDPPAVEPFSSELVGARRGIVLGKKSGIASIRIKLDDLGLDVPEDLHPELLQAVKRTGSEKAGLVSDDEFRRIVDRVVAG